jgi:hypothetical protein
MKLKENNVAVIEPSDALVVEAEEGGESVRVYRDAQGVYHVFRNGEVKHTPCSAEDAMRALGFYLHGALYKASKCSPAQGAPYRMQTPPDEGPIKGTAIAERMIQICGCKGRRDCDCVSVKNQARRELWTEHNQRAAGSTVA